MNAQDRSHSLDILDTKSSSVWIGYMPVNDRVQFQADIVLCRYSLLGYSDQLNLDIDDSQTFTARIDLDETRIDGLVELTKSTDKSDGSLLDLFEGVRARAAWELTKRTSAATNAIDECSVEAMINVFQAQVLNVEKGVLSAILQMGNC